MKKKAKNTKNTKVTKKVNKVISHLKEDMGDFKKKIRSKKPFTKAELQKEIERDKKLIKGLKKAKKK